MIEKNIYLYRKYSTLEDYILSFNIFRQLIKRKQNKKILINHNKKTFLKNIYKSTFSNLQFLWIDVI